MAELSAADRALLQQAQEQARATNDTTNHRRDRQGHQRATGAAGADPAGLVLDRAVVCVGRGAVAARPVGALPDGKGLQMGSIATGDPLAASA